MGNSLQFRTRPDDVLFSERITMRYDFFPDREGEMLAWGKNLAQRLAVSPGRYGISESELEAFAEAVNAFAAAYARTSAPATRTTTATQEKRSARIAMERLGRRIAKRLTGMEGLTDQERASLGLTIPRPRTAHVLPPAVAPGVLVVGVEGKRLRLVLTDEERPTRRARPDNATGATILYHVGTHPPMDRSGWRLAISTTRTRLTLSLELNVPAGTPVWLTAFWRNRRDECSPGSRPVRACLGEGLAA